MDIQRNYSVLNPSAQIHKMCAVPGLDYLDLVVNRLNELVDSISPSYEGCILELLLLSGCRISEILSIRCGDYLGANQVFVRGIKGSKDRVVTCNYNVEQIIRNRDKNGLVFYGYNRWYIYRLLRKFNVGELFGLNKNASVTHLFRHIKVLQLKRAGLSTEQIKDFMGHKNIKSTIFYEQEFKRK